MQRFADNARWRAEMGVRNRAWAENTLSWSAVTDRYHEIYEDVAKHPARGDGSRPAATGSP